ncbi:MAG: GAF domain-containing protein [Anaerolineales bacterium]|nr:GAF domain-containing protein [Anaerolineales bacterium]
MLTSIKKIFASPVFPDNEEKTRAAGILNYVLLTLLGISILLIGWSAFSATSIMEQPELLYIASIISWFIMLVLWLSLRRGYVAGIGLILTITLTVVMAVLTVIVGTIRTPGIIAMFIMVTMIAGLTVGQKTMYLSALLNAVVVFFITQAEVNGQLPPPPPTSMGTSISFGLILVLFAALLGLALQNLDVALKNAKRNQKELADLNTQLEQNVKERTRALATSIEISRRLTTILDQQQLLKAVVEQVQMSFNYYHVHIYMINAIDESLVMAGGTGEASRTMLERGHTISKGKGLVGRAAAINKFVLVADTSSDPDWLPNPLLPDTKSEIAVPISIGNQVLGVLDVQHNLTDGLTNADADLLQSIANQIAIALKNAQTYMQTQQQAERETMINEISRKIQNTATVEHALQVTVRELGQALGVKDSRVILSLPDTLQSKGN